MRWERTKKIIGAQETLKWMEMITGEYLLRKIPFSFGDNNNK